MWSREISRGGGGGGIKRVADVVGVEVAAGEAREGVDLSAMLGLAALPVLRATRGAVARVHPWSSSLSSGSGTASRSGIVRGGSANETVRAGCLPLSSRTAGVDIAELVSLPVGASRRSEQVDAAAAVTNEGTWKANGEASKSRGRGSGLSKTDVRAVFDAEASSMLRAKSCSVGDSAVRTEDGWRRRS